jgi:Na+-translocating ferredoxin:NAD+ oxidoreductase RnfG subunit
MFEKTCGANAIILMVCILAAVYLVYSIFGSTTEVYYYSVAELTKNSRVLTVEKDRIYTNYTHAKMYDIQKNPVGDVSTVNFHQVIDGKNRVTTLTTFTTKTGSIVCNMYYETNPDNQYLLGKIADVAPENETGAYRGKKVTVHLNGKPDGERELTIIMGKKWF